jgi:two-component system, sensor histidine kinase and response regulator
LKADGGFPIVLLDQELPGTDGYELAGQIRGIAARKQPVIVLLSSSQKLTDQERAKGLGIERRLLKPLRRSTLFEAIREGLRLPTPRSSPQTDARELRQGRAVRVLLVEDNRVNQVLAIRLLRKMGHDVTLAVNGREAVEVFQRKAFDVLLMDIQMPVMSGVEATQKIREEERKTKSHIPIIAMTAHAMAGDAEKYISAGMDGYVSKPVRTDLLRAEIDRLTRDGRTKAQPSGKERGSEMAKAHVDFEELLLRVENDRELMREVILIFKEEFPRHYQALREAIEQQDGKQVAFEGHRLKGMLLNLAAQEAAGAAARLELLGRNGVASEFAEAFTAFERIAGELLPELDSCLMEVPR